MKYGQIFIGIVLCIVLEYSIFNLNHKYNFWEPIFTVRSTISNEKRGGGGILTNPLLECIGVEDNDHISQLNISKFSLNDYVSEIIKIGKVGFISVYVRDLNNGPWIGINEKEEFIGGSLLKVPLMMTFLNMSEYNQDLLFEKIEYKEKIIDDTQYFPSAKLIEVGKSYTIKELLEYMIIYSDNNAAELLISRMSNNDLEKTFESLGLGKPNPNIPYPINTKTYAGFFRVLFNSSYLDKEKSEEALKLLTMTDFNSGLTARLPSQIIVAHKYGIRIDNNINQLHDCGIVYYPKHPYLICVMSKVGKFDDLAKAIADISKFVYDEVSVVKN